MQRLKILCFWALAIITLGSCEQISQTKTFYLAHTLPTTHPVHLGMVDFQELVAQNSNGKLAVKIFPDGQLGSEREMLELLQIGSVAMTKVSAAVMASFSPEYEILGVPYLFRDRTHLFEVLEGEIGESLLNSSRTYLLQGLCFYDAGSRSFYTTKKAIRTPKDLKGLKIRVMNHQMSVDMVNAMGGSATPMAYGELYTALQQGVMDGAENNPPSFVSSNHFEVCKYYTLDEHTSIPDVLVVGTKFWDNLTEEEKGWVKDAAMRSVASQKQYWQASVEDCMAKLDEAGVEVIIPDKSLFSEKTEKVLNKFSQDPKMKALIDAIQ
ncbi:MAG: TRAP transporter substrate-binding protein [Bacteroidota bacterium]